MQPGCPVVRGGRECNRRGSGVLVIPALPVQLRGSGRHRPWAAGTPTGPTHTVGRIVSVGPRCRKGVPRQSGETGPVEGAAARPILPGAEAVLHRVPRHRAGRRLAHGTILVPRSVPP